MPMLETFGGKLLDVDYLKVVCGITVKYTVVNDVNRHKDTRGMSETNNFTKC